MIRITLDQPRRADTDVEERSHVSNTLPAHEPLQTPHTEEPLLHEVAARAARVSCQAVHHGLSHTTTRAALRHVPTRQGARPLRQT